MGTGTGRHEEPRGLPIVGFLEWIGMAVIASVLVAVLYIAFWASSVLGLVLLVLVLVVVLKPLRRWVWQSG
jgi:hypothetical protein